MTFLLELKQKAGLATPEEIHVLENTPIIVGEGLVVPRPLSSAAWRARWHGVTIPGFFVSQEEIDATAEVHSEATTTANEPPQPSVTQADEGLILCKPGCEPAPAGKPG